MDSLLLPSQSTCLAIASHTVCSKSSGSAQDRKRVLLSSSYSRVQTKLLASLKVADQHQLRSVKGRSGLGARATMATEEGGVNEAKLDTKEDGVNEGKLAVEEETVNEPKLSTEVEAVTEAQVATEEEEVGDAEPTNSGSEDAVAQSVEVLKRAGKTKKVSASEICAAFKVLEKAKLDPKDFLSVIGGTKSPGRSWLLIFTSGKDLNKSEGKYFPVTAVQTFDTEAGMIENGVYLGSLGELAFQGNFVWAKRKLSFNFYTLKLKIGPLGPFSFSVGKKDKEITNTDPFFIWSYADDEIIVCRGRGGGTAVWVRCSRVNKSPI